jgi:hypothetical protein
VSNEHVHSVIRATLDAICAPAEKTVAPLTVEVSDDQNTARDTRQLEFVEAVCETGWRTCVFCVASTNYALCERLPCSGLTRKDGRNGYFREVRG